METYRELSNLVFRRVEHYQDWIRIEHFLLLRRLGLIFRRGRFHRNDFRLRLFCNDELVAHDLKIEIFLEVVDNMDYGSRITSELVRIGPSDEPWQNPNLRLPFRKPWYDFGFTRGLTARDTSPYFDLIWTISELTGPMKLVNGDDDDVIIVFDRVGCHIWRSESSNAKKSSKAPCCPRNINSGFVLISSFEYPRSNEITPISWWID